MAWSAHKKKSELKEHFCDEQTLEAQAKELAELIKTAKYFVAFTGAGISTSAGIPDFRGPEGVWTLESQGKKPKFDVDTVEALPTTSHMALVSLQKAGILKFLISQNCDGLHKRSGFPSDFLAELHGNENLEYCKTCGKEYLRDFLCDRDNKKLSDHSTGRLCSCGGILWDSLIHFSESLPEKAVEAGFDHARKSDLFLVLGSSLTVTPANEMPEAATKSCPKAKLVICNLQKTPLDDKCHLRIFAKCDDLMKKVMNELGLNTPEWRLERLLEISLVCCDEEKHLQKLSIRGVEADNTSTSYLSAVEMYIAKTQNGWKQNYEPFETKVPLSEKSVKLKLTLHFMGHYKEPPLKLEPTFTNSKSAEGTVKRFRLVYNPNAGVWQHKLIC